MRSVECIIGGRIGIGRTAHAQGTKYERRKCEEKIETRTHEGVKWRERERESKR
jgi:hypothetical protein